MVPIPTKRWRSAVVAFFLAATAGHAQALTVFACEPEWAALVQTLHPQASVFAATHADQDPHHVEARPSLVAALRRADLAVCTGASLEVGWLPMLQSRAANARVRNGSPGMFYAAEHTELMDAGESADRAGGDVHPEGNPHFHLHPARLLDVARALTTRLRELDPSNDASIAAAFSQFETNWAAHTARWAAQRDQLQGKSVVVQHSAFRYLLAFLDVSVVADLEPLPGLPPTLAHLRTVLKQVGDTPPAAIIQTRYQQPQPGQWLSERINSPVLTLPSTVTDDKSADELHELFDLLINQLVSKAR